MVNYFQPRRRGVGECNGTFHASTFANSQQDHLRRTNISSSRFKCRLEHQLRPSPYCIRPDIDCRRALRLLASHRGSDDQGGFLHQARPAEVIRDARSHTIAPPAEGRFFYSRRRRRSQLGQLIASAARFDDLFLHNRPPPSCNKSCLSGRHTQTLSHRRDAVEAQTIGRSGGKGLFHDGLDTVADLRKLAAKGLRAALEKCVELYSVLACETRMGRLYVEDLNPQIKTRWT